MNDKSDDDIIQDGFDAVIIVGCLILIGATVLTPLIVLGVWLWSVIM